MAVSDDLARLSVRGKQAEDRAAAAKAQAHDQLQQAVQEARDSTQQTADRLRAESAATADRVDAWADDIQRSWDEHLAWARERIDARRAPHAADRAESDAESYAAHSIDLSRPDSGSMPVRRRTRRHARSPGVPTCRAEAFDPGAIPCDRCQGCSRPGSPDRVRTAREAFTCPRSATSPRRVPAEGRSRP